VNPAYRPIGVGVTLLIGAIVLDAAGSFFQSLPLLVASFAVAIAGAVISVRGVIEFVAEKA
jgi:hypothetical protein